MVLDGKILEKTADENKMKPYADKYFLRMREILEAKGINPWINMQVFVRKGPGKIAGLDEAIETIMENSNLAEVGGRIYAKKEHEEYESKETTMNIIAPVQEIAELETNYLGIKSTATTRLNDDKDLNFGEIGRQMRDVVELAGDRPVLYFGARHWHWTYDTELARLAFENGITAVSTDNGTILHGREGTGTIPHALENVFAYYYGMDRAVVEATRAFDEVIDPNVPRIALVDYNNKEITDTIETAKTLDGRLDGVRVDTCGENIQEGGVDGNIKYWNGKGVTVEGIRRLRNELDKEGFSDVGIILSSGFSNPEKVKAFNEAESYFGMKLYDGIGAGFLDNVRTATADIVGVGDTKEEVDFYDVNNKVTQENIIHKAGRSLKPNYELKRRV